MRSKEWSLPGTRGGGNLAAAFDGHQVSVIKMSESRDVLYSTVPVTSRAPVCTENR